MRFELDLPRWSRTIANNLRTGRRLSWAVAFARNICNMEEFAARDQSDKLVKFVKCVATGNVTSSGRAECLMLYYGGSEVNLMGRGI